MVSVFLDTTHETILDIPLIAPCVRKEGRDGTGRDGTGWEWGEGKEKGKGNRNRNRNMKGRKLVVCYQCGMLL
jgi:hypothetical protein